MRSHEFVTANPVKQIKARRVTENEQDVAYVKIWMEDENGMMKDLSVLQNMINYKCGIKSSSTKRDFS